MDLVVEKATELGVKTIIPFLSSYAVPKLDEKKIIKAYRALAEDRSQRGQTMRANALCRKSCRFATFRN